MQTFTGEVVNHHLTHLIGAYLPQQGRWLHFYRHYTAWWFLQLMTEDEQIISYFCSLVPQEQSNKYSTGHNLLPSQLNNFNGQMEISKTLYSVYSQPTNQHVSILVSQLK